MSNESEVQQALLALDSGDLALQIDALHRLRPHQDEQIAPRLIPLLRDANPEIRRLAAEVLGKNGGSGVVQALIDALFDTDASVRDAVVDALGALGDRAAVPALTEALYDEAIDVRFAATEALKLLADPRAVIDLIHVLDTDDAPLAAMAAMALHTIGTPEALAAIQHLREGDHYHFELFPEDVPQLDDTVRHVPIATEQPEEVADDEQAKQAEETLRHIPANLIEDYLEEEEALPPEATREADATKVDPQTRDKSDDE